MYITTHTLLCGEGEVYLYGSVPVPVRKTSTYTYMNMYTYGKVSVRVCMYIDVYLCVFYISVHLCHTHVRT
jgi:hypothetical protein